MGDVSIKPTRRSLAKGLWRKAQWPVQSPERTMRTSSPSKMPSKGPEVAEYLTAFPGSRTGDGRIKPLEKMACIRPWSLILNLMLEQRLDSVDLRVSHVSKRRPFHLARSL